MIELSIGLVALLLLAIVICLSAFRKAKLSAVIFTSLLVISAGLMYRQWGAYQDMWLLEKKLEQRAMVAKAMKQYKGPEEIIAKMEAHLKAQPKSVKGWLLLGKLYASAKAFTKANDAFAKAYALDNNNPEISLNYLESQYYLDDQSLTPKTQQLLDEIFQKWPNQLDALNFAAMDAYIHQNYHRASSYWQKMLPALSDGSKEKQTILKAIGEAQQKSK